MVEASLLDFEQGEKQTTLPFVPDSLKKLCDRLAL
jgi:hypothetical protein